jgi:hypothetical protein
LPPNWSNDPNQQWTLHLYQYDPLKTDRAQYFIEGNTPGNAPPGTGFFLSYSNQGISTVKDGSTVYEVVVLSGVGADGNPYAVNSNYLSEALGTDNSYAVIYLAENSAVDTHQRWEFAPI